MHPQVGSTKRKSAGRRPTPSIAAGFPRTDPPPARTVRWMSGFRCASTRPAPDG